MNKALRFLLDLVTLTTRCPDCGSPCKMYMSPTNSEPNIYECQKCGKEWVIP